MANNTEELYKYLDYDGAKKTLENCDVKFSSPLVFNDPFDICIGDLLGLEIKKFAKVIPTEFFNILLSDIDYQSLRPDLKPEFKDQIIYLNQMIKTLPDEVKNELYAEHNMIPLESLCKWDQKTIQRYITEIQKIFGSYGIFCSSKRKDSILMWSHYGDHHKGVVLKFQPNIEKDSFFLASKQIDYSHERPLFYKTPNDLLQHYLMNKPPMDIIIEKLIFTKSLDWAYENEYRIAIPDLIPNERKYTTLHFDPGELSAVYFGCRMIEEKKDELISLARKLNSRVEFYQASLAKREYALEWEPKFPL